MEFKVFFYFKFKTVIFKPCLEKMGKLNVYGAHGEDLTFMVKEGFNAAII